MNDRLAGYAYDREETIVWLQPSDACRYVREALVLCRFRARQPHAAPGAQLVAYATLRPDAPPERTHRFLRRVWYAAPDAEGGVLPVDAVEPGSVRAGQASLPARYAYAPTPVSDDCGAGLETQGPRTTAETEPPGIALRVKRVSVPCDPASAAAVLRRHLTPDQLHELATALLRSAAHAEPLPSA